jgi:hypothetical protein
MLFPERLDDYLAEDNLVRAIDVFVDALDLAGLGFVGVGTRVNPQSFLRESFEQLRPAQTIDPHRPTVSDGEHSSLILEL